MRRLVSSIILVLFLVGSVYGAMWVDPNNPNLPKENPDPGDPYRDAGCMLRPLGTSINVYDEACFDGGGFGGSHSSIDDGDYSNLIFEGVGLCYKETESFEERFKICISGFANRGWRWNSNCKCTDWNKAKSDNSVCSYDRKVVNDDPRPWWGWETRDVSEGLFISWVKGEQVNPSSCKDCRGPAVGVYGESFTITHPNPVPTQTPPGESHGRPVAITYLRCDTSMFTKDGSQKVYKWKANGGSDPKMPSGDYDLIYGSYGGGVYQCGYTPDLRDRASWADQSKYDPLAFQTMIPVAGMILTELDPNKKYVRALEEAKSTDPLIKSYEKTSFGAACNPVATCPINTGCPGDFNGDGKVDASDMAVLSENWKKSNCAPGNGCCGGVDIAKCPGETGNTGRVDECDLAALAANFGKSCSEIVPAPPKMPGGDKRIGGGKDGIIWIW